MHLVFVCQLFDFPFYTFCNKQLGCFLVSLLPCISVFLCISCRTDILFLAWCRVTGGLPNPQGELGLCCRLLVSDTGGTSSFSGPIPCLARGSALSSKPCAQQIGVRSGMVSFLVCDSVCLCFVAIIVVHLFLLVSQVVL